MKKIGVILVIVFIVFMMISKEEEVMIPKEAIRLRVIANSDSDVDQLTKTLVRNEIQEQLATDMKENKTIKEARKKINDNLTTYSNLVEKTFIAYICISFSWYLDLRLTKIGCRETTIFVLSAFLFRILPLSVSAAFENFFRRCL